MVRDRSSTLAARKVHAIATARAAQESERARAEGCTSTCRARFHTFKYIVFRERFAVVEAVQQRLSGDHHYLRAA